MTCTVKLQELEPPLFVAMQLTVVRPAGKTLPEGGAQDTTGGGPTAFVAVTV